MSCLHESKVDIELSDEVKAKHLRKDLVSLDFKNSNDFKFDPNFVNIDTNGAQLKKIDTKFSGSDFTSGNHVGTSINNNKLSFNPTPGTDFRGINQKWVPRSDKVIWYWSMDSGSLPITDLINNVDSSNCNSNLVFDNEAIADDSLLIANGTEGNCEVPSINQIGDEITISGWIKNQDGFKAPWLPIITKTNGSRGFNIHRNNTSNEVYLRVDTDLATNSSCFSTGATPLDGDWNHIAFTLNRGDVKAYVNGVLVNNCSYSHGLGFSTTSETLLSFFRVSYGPGETRFDEWVFWSEELSENEIFTIYDHQKGNYSELSSDWTPHWNDIVGYWKMDGNWQDSSGNGNHVDSLALGDISLTSDAKVGAGAVSLDGDGDRIKFDGFLDSSFERKGSISLWIKNRITDFSTQDRFLMRSYYSSNDNIYLRFRSTNEFWFGVIAGSSSQIISISNADEVFPVGKWVHVTGTWDLINKDKLSLFIDGEKVGERSQTTDISGTLSWAYLGYATSICFDGIVDEFAIFSEDLSSSEVATIYNRQKQKYAASYKSPVVDLASPQNINQLSKTTDLPFMKELTTTSESSSDYTSLSGDLSDGLVGYWPLDGLIGVIADNDNIPEKVTITGNGLAKDSDLSNTIRYHPGLLGQSIGLDGQNDYVEIPDFDLNQNDRLSVSIWVKALPESDTYVFSHYNFGAANDRSWLLGKSSLNSSKAMFVVSSDGSFTNRKSYHSSKDVFDGKWHHLVGTFFQGETKIYIDGVEDLAVSKNVDAAITTIHNSSTNIRIGAGANNGVLSKFSHGFFDEAAIWNRALSSKEIEQLYRRGANRVKYQIRTCSDSTCSSDSEWKGPGGDGTTYFSELYNRSSADISSMFSSCDASGDNLCSSDEFSFTGATQRVPYQFDFDDSLINNYSALNTRYFQYRVLMEAEENTACGGEPCLPSVTAINFETANDYFDISPSVTSKKPMTISKKILKVEEKTVGGCSVKYQFSKDGTNFSYYKASRWISAMDIGTQANTVDQISSVLKDFISSGSLYVRAYLISNGNQSCELESLTIRQ